MREKVAYTVDQAADATGISRNLIYRAAHEGRLDLRQYGRRTLVTAESLRRFIDQLPNWDAETHRPEKAVAGRAEQRRRLATPEATV